MMVKKSQRFYHNEWKILLLTVFCNDNKAHQHFKMAVDTGQADRENVKPAIRR